MKKFNVGGIKFKESDVLNIGWNSSKKNRAEKRGEKEIKNISRSLTIEN